MPAPNILDAVNQLQTALRAINGAPTYTFTVQSANVEQIGSLWFQVEDSRRPYIGIQLMGMRHEYWPSRQIFQIADVRLVCHLPFTESFAQRLTDQQEFFDDIMTAINAGPGGLTLNSNVIDTRVERWEVDASDPLATHTIHVFVSFKTRRGPGPS